MLDFAALFGGESISLVQHLIGDADLADIVQQARLPDEGFVTFPQTEFLSNFKPKSGNSLRVAPRVAVAGFEGAGQG